MVCFGVVLSRILIMPDHKGKFQETINSLLKDIPKKELPNKVFVIEVFAIESEANFLLEEKKNLQN